MRKLRLLVLIGAVVLEAGCGLPDSFLLVPPARGGQFPAGTINSPFSIAGTSRAQDLDVVFKGYELYYKCYGLQDSLTADENYNSTSNTYTDLLQNGFHRICRGPGSGPTGLPVDTYPGTANIPLIDISRIDQPNVGSNYSITINVNDLLPPAFNFTAAGSIPVTYFEYFQPAASTPFAGWEIRRYVQADPSLGLVCKTFADNSYYPLTPNWTSSDIDMTPTAYNSATTNGQIYVMMYAVCYGTGLDGTPRFSSPTWLGYSLLQVF